jgi:UDP-N-acetylmuramate dehydrogenase
MMDERQRTGLVRIGGMGIQFDRPMNRYTTFRVGGKAEAIYFAHAVDELHRMVTFLNQEHIPYLAVGKGSNLLVGDGGLEGVVIILRGRLAAIESRGDQDQIPWAGGGLSIARLLIHCRRKGLGGLEFLSGIPGTVGGAVAMNAGAFGEHIGRLVQEIRVVTHQEKLEAMKGSEIKFSYRESSIPEGTVIVKVRFQFKREEPEAIAKRVKQYLARKRAGQPLEYPSGGSIFKNPPNHYAGRLIERVGLKGKEIGGAMISPKHANFIVNTGEASSEDILALMALARERVMEETGIDLEPEIKVVGRQ